MREQRRKQRQNTEPLNEIATAHANEFELLMHLYYSAYAKVECAVVKTTKSKNRAVGEFGLVA